MQYTLLQAKYMRCQRKKYLGLVNSTFIPEFKQNSKDVMPNFIFQDSGVNKNLSI